MLENTMRVDLYDRNIKGTDVNTGDPSQEDSDYFKSLMSDLDNHDQPKSTFERVDGLSDALSSKKEIFDKSVEKAMKTSDQKDVLQATRNMSDYYLYTTMAAKIAQKSQSAIEKLTNIQ